MPTQNRAIDALRHRCVVLRKQLIETWQVPCWSSACHVMKRQHGVGLAAAEVGLKFDHRIAARAGEPPGSADQKRAESVGKVGAAEELPGIPIFRWRAASVDLAEIGGELRLQEIAGCDVMVRFDDLAPGQQATGRIDGNLHQPLGLAALLVAPKLSEPGAQYRVAHPAESFSKYPGADGFQQATHGIQRTLGIVIGKRLVVRELVTDGDQFVHDRALSASQHGLERV